MERTETTLHSLNELMEDSNNEFKLIYRGMSEVDRHYTRPMLPWIIYEVKQQNKFEQVIVNINRGFVTVIAENDEIKMSHPVRQIHKCVMEQNDHSCFLYTLRPPEKDSSHVSSLGKSNSCQLVPANVNTQNYQCFLFQADTESIVKSFISCLRQQPRETSIQDNNGMTPLNSLPDLSVHNESQFFEVLFIGRVKVSHPKVPDIFIDEAVKAFKQKERIRGRRNSGSIETSQSTHQANLMAFQRDGSGYSMPANANFSHSLKALERLSPDPDAQPGFSSDLDKGLEQSSIKIKEPNDPPIDEDTDCDMVVVEPMKRQRLRTVSGDSPSILRQLSSPYMDGGTVPMMRARAGSIGSMMQKSKSIDLKTFGSDFNRTMLFHIGRNEVQLINTDIKSVQLNKSIKDIAHCCQGMKYNDHFGFICREIDGESSIFVGYVFRCEKSSFTNEIMQSLVKVFNAAHEAHIRDKQDHKMCDLCPMRWFGSLCTEVEGLPAAKAHSVIMKKVQNLPEDDREVIIAKYEGAETKDPQSSNNVLMMLLRPHFEYKQTKHSHASLYSSTNKNDTPIGTNFEFSIKRAKKTLATSFNQLLKRDGREGDSSERELTPTSEDVPRSSARSPSIEKSTVGNNSKLCLEGISDSPLSKPRPRSSTVSAAGGDSMMKEFRAKRLAQRKTAENQAASSSSGFKNNLLMKFGSPSMRKQEEDINSTDTKSPSKSNTSFRHSILQIVTTPGKTSSDPYGAIQNRNTAGSQPVTPKKRTRQQLKNLWKKCIFQYILLIRMERESQRLRELQQEQELMRVCLNYEEEHLERDVLQTWEMMVSRPKAHIDTNILYGGIKHGVPKHLRGDVWHLLWLRSNREDTPKFPLPPSYNVPYDKMIKELTKEQHAILIDLGRTFPCHPYFQQPLGPGQLSLFNILKAYSILDQEVGYCQGLSFVAGILLLHVEEEMAYNLLKHLMYVKGCRRQYRPTLDGLQVHMYQLYRLLRDQLRALYDHLEEHEITPQLYAAPWFLTLFASQFQMSFVVRIFDLLLLKGMESLFCVALSILTTFEQQLLACNSLEEIMNYFKTVICNIQVDQSSAIFARACEYSFEEKLMEYAVEYNVLQEEHWVTPQHEAEMKKLKESNKNLQRQNLELVEELHNKKADLNALENASQSLHQSQHHLEIRVRWLELERNNMRLLIAELSKNATPEALAAVSPSLERYLPHKASSPSPVSRRPHYLSIPASTTLSDKKVEEDNEEKESETGDTTTDLLQLKSNTNRPKSQSPVRSNTLDIGNMHKYMKNLVTHH